MPRNGIRILSEKKEVAAYNEYSFRVDMSGFSETMNTRAASETQARSNIRFRLSQKLGKTPGALKAMEQRGELTITKVGG
jgi:hypothetical protein